MTANRWLFSCFLLAAGASFVGCSDATPNQGDGGNQDGNEDGGDHGCLPVQLCNGTCCPSSQVCLTNTCVPSDKPCSSDNDCQEDSYCENGICIPYGTGPREDTNPNCTHLIVAGLFQPSLQCEWTGPPVGDTYPDHIQVLGTPMVADFNFDDNPETIRPSIVFNSYDGLDGDSGTVTTLNGVLRIIDGQTCQTQFTIGPHLNGCNPVAIGDLDNDADGRPEIVVHGEKGGVIAYKYDATSKSWQTLWTGHRANNEEVVFALGSTGWGGPSLADLNNDGRPEVLSGGLVYDNQGLLQDEHLGLAALHAVGFPVAADIDQDGQVELVNGDFVWQFDTASLAWVVDKTTGKSKGYTAVADFGSYPEDPAQYQRAVLDGIAEVAVVSGGRARIQTAAGSVLLDVALPASTGGGPPTVGDFDGDGRAELAAAGSDSYTVFDLDCQETPSPESCPTMRTDGILWTQVSQDHSSNITGSSLFDFEGDGPVEAVYADECFVRVYRGSDGKVIFSQWRSSCTWNENPIVADVDGDFSAELVVPSNKSCSVAPQTLGGRNYDVSPQGKPMDPLFAGLPCKDGSDCSSGTCDALYCRCTDDSQCGGGGFVCAPPPTGTAGIGNTCRAEWQGSINGVRVYRDSLDRWVGTRTIWNQHAYSITNVEENGKIPATSEAKANWKDPKLNNFRQNKQGNLNPNSSPDLTASQGSFDKSCSGGQMTLHVRICNRGTYPISSGIAIGFFDGDPAAGASLLCSTATLNDLTPGECQTSDCTWSPTADTSYIITVVVDYNSEHSECLEGNNKATIKDVSCPPT